MNVICDKEQYNKPIVLALGFFDCVHVGHLALVNETKKMALSMKCETAICTFSNDPNALLNKSKQNALCRAWQRALLISFYKSLDVQIAGLDDFAQGLGGVAQLLELGVTERERYLAFDAVLADDNGYRQGDVADTEAAVLNRRHGQDTLLVADDRLANALG